MAKKIKRGQPITELVKGSLEYTRHVIVRAFYRTYSDNDYENEYLWVEEIFDAYIIVSSNQLPVDEFYMVVYERDGTEVKFAPRDEWEIVELAYQLAGSQSDGEGEGEGESTTAVVTEKTSRDGVSIREVNPSAARLVTEAESKKPRLEAKLAQADVINNNGRRYRRLVLREAVEEARDHLHESFSQGRAILTGEDAHPGDKRQTPMLREAVVVWDDVWFDEESGWVHIAGDIVETAVGRDVLAILRAGLLPPISLRAYGEFESVEENGREIQDVLWLRLTGADLLVSDPGFAGAGVTLFEESAKMNEIEKLQKKLEETQAELAELRKDKNDKDAKAAIAEKEQAIKALQTQLEEAQAKAAKLEKAEADRQAELEEQAQEAAKARQAEEDALREKLGVGPDADITEALARQRQQIEEYEAKQAEEAAAAVVTEAVKDLVYPTAVRESFVEYVGRPANEEEAQAKIEEAKKLFDPLAAKMRLQGMGFNGGVQDVAPVIEKELNIPAYAIAAHEITEAMIAHGHWQPRSKRSKTSRAARFTERYLKLYDKWFQQQLIAEARMWQEAMTTTQINNPYSVIRAIMDEAFPQLVALSVFDAGTVENNPARIFYEVQYTAETGNQVSVSDETATAADDTWVALDNKRITHSSVVVRSAGSGGGTLYTYGTDYVIDHTDGRIMTLSSGSISNGATIYCSYDYVAMRKGENAGIERAKSTLQYVDLSMTADRLATEITDEAIKFSRSQLGFDAVARTINLLMKEVMRRIDNNLMHDALSRVLTVASNSGGTWTSSTDPLSEFPEKIGYARVKVGNRYYTPQAVLMSLTNSDLLSNWDGFTAAGSRPDADLDEAGYVGRVKGLPVFASTEFTDSFVLVHNREVLMYRVYSPMEMKGPYPTYDSNRELVANDQYFIQEYNGYVSPIPGKGAYMKVA